MARGADGVETSGCPALILRSPHIVSGLLAGTEPALVDDRDQMLDALDGRIAVRPGHVGNAAIEVYHQSVDALRAGDSMDAIHASTHFDLGVAGGEGTSQQS